MTHEDVLTFWFGDVPGAKLGADGAWRLLGRLPYWAGKWGRVVRDVDGDMRRRFSAELDRAAVLALLVLLGPLLTATGCTAATVVLASVLRLLVLLLLALAVVAVAATRVRPFHVVRAVLVVEAMVLLTVSPIVLVRRIQAVVAVALLISILVM